MAGGFKSLYSFKGNPDGQNPYAGMVAIKGTLYGTTELGGKHDFGVLYKVSTSGAERVLHTFTGSSSNRRLGAIWRAYRLKRCALRHDVLWRPCACRLRDRLQGEHGRRRAHRLQLPIESRRIPICGRGRLKRHTVWNHLPRWKA